MNSQVKSKAPFILVVVGAFFVYQLIILVNSFPADYRIAVNDFGSFSNTGSVMPLFHLGSELTGEVGVILRFAGACLFLAFVVTLLWKKTFSWQIIRKAVLLEGIYYLFNIPFITYLFVRTPSSIANYGAAISYATQMLLVTPLFLTLYLKLKSKNFEVPEVARWAALAITGLIFALWVKHFALALYALPAFSTEDAVLAVGFVNSALTLLVAGLLTIVAFMPVIKKRNVRFNHRLFGAALIIAGLYAVIFLLVCALNKDYAAWVGLIDWWIIAMPVLGASLLTNHKTSSQVHS